MSEHELRIEGMSCNHCVRAVEGALRGVPGVRDVAVSIGSARVEADEGVTRDDLVRAIEEEDFRVTG